VTCVALCATPSDNRLLVAGGSDDKSVQVWDVATGLPVGEPLTGHGSWRWSNLRGAGSVAN
jgi:WD40 repeat protein